jgi:hypothetical protein
MLITESPLDISDDVFDGVDLFSTSLSAKPRAVPGRPSTNLNTTTNNGRGASTSVSGQVKKDLLLEAKLGPAFFKVKNPEKMEEIDQYRKDYQLFRLGEPHGTKAEVSEIMDSASDEEGEGEDDEDDEDGEGGREKGTK